jgi:integrase
VRLLKNNLGVSHPPLLLNQGLSLPKGDLQMRLSPPKQGRAITVRKRKRIPNRALTEAQIRLLLSSIENIHDDALIRLGLSVGLRVSEVVSIRTSEIDFDRGLVKIWDEKKDRWRYVMPTNEGMSAIKKYLNSLPK